MLIDGHPRVLRKKLEKLSAILECYKKTAVACSGGVDSMLLATLSNRISSYNTIVYHAVSPAVPSEATERLRAWAERENMEFKLIDGGEFQDSRYINNPKNRCYYCKTNLYSAIKRDLVRNQLTGRRHEIMSGTNRNDLDEYRPGLIAADMHDVRHPYVESGIGKEDIRNIARKLELPFSELPASPCLSSRVYVGNRIENTTLRTIEICEKYLRDKLLIDVVRCRVNKGQMFIEVLEPDREKITEDVTEYVEKLVRKNTTEVHSVSLYPEAYASGRAFLVS